MADPNLAEVLDDFLTKCTLTPAGEITRNGTPITAELLAGRRLPKRLEQFLAEYIANPEYSAQGRIVMSSMLQDFGARMFRRLLHIGLNRRQCETDQAQNVQDVAFAGRLLRELASECAHTPFLPRDAAELLGRIANALHDIGWNNSRPALLDNLPAVEGGISNTARNWSKGHLAAALEIVICGGMKLAEAKDWLEVDMRRAGLVDEAGNAIGAARVASWRNNFRKGIGAHYARAFFQIILAECKPLLGAPPGKRKRAACENYARRLVGMLAIQFNRTVAPSLKK